MLKKHLRVFGLIFLVVTVHEAAHAATAIFAGVTVKRFSFGFGPGFSIPDIPLVNELHFGIIPLGAYVEVDGNEISKMSLLVVIVFCLAGVLANFFTALFLSLPGSKNKIGIITETCLRTIGGPKPLWDGPLNLRWWEKWSPIGIWKVAVNSNRTFHEKLIWLSLLLAQINLMPLYILDGGKAVSFILLTVMPTLDFWAFAIMMGFIFMFYLDLIGAVSQILQKRDMARVKTNTISITATVDFIRHHKLQLTGEEQEHIEEIFYRLRFDMDRTDDKNIPIVVAIANQRLNEYLRSINKLPQP